MLERLFQLSAHGTTVRTELLAGLTTFLAMAYILFVNPALLAQAGMDPGAVFVATALSAAFGSACMGLLANYPVALAPGMGLNAFFTYTVVLGMGYTWQSALGAVFLSALLFFILSLLRIRAWIIHGLPPPLRAAIAAGIGLFLALIALKEAGIIVAHPATLAALGDLGQPGSLLAIGGFLLTLGLLLRQIPGALLLGMLAVSLTSILLGLTPFAGLVALPPSLAPTLLQLDLAGALDIGLSTVVFTFLFVDLFDNTGTLLAVTRQAGLDQPARLDRALRADSLAALAGALLGTSTTTSYIESGAGISAGGRTGLTALTTAGLFLLALFFAPLASSVPAAATAPALLLVGVLLCSELTGIDWQDPAVAAPALMTALGMPLTFSIAQGIALGLITWVAIRLISGRWRELNALLVALAALFVLKLGWFA